MKLLGCGKCLKHCFSYLFCFKQGTRTKGEEDVCRKEQRPNSQANVDFTTVGIYWFGQKVHSGWNPNEPFGQPNITKICLSNEVEIVPSVYLIM